MRESFDTIERAKLQRICSTAALSTEGKVNQRGLARDVLPQFKGRTYASVYAEIRRMFRTGGWWDNVPVSHSVIV